jgi:hypothetical protein
MPFFPAPFPAPKPKIREKYGNVKKVVSSFFVGAVRIKKVWGKH